jgi:hypothetical protein
LRTPEPTQPLSARAYAITTAAGLVLAVGFTLFYIFGVPKLVENGIQNQIFYLLLIPWALSCAAFLFGTMGSYARFKHKRLGSVLELGGPVVLFCLVVVGGFRLVPSPPETFDLTARCHSEDGRDPVITTGRITVDFNTDRRTESIGANGEADFKGIPSRFRHATLQVLPQVEGYEEQWQEYSPTDNVIDVPLKRAHPVTTLTGSIVPTPRKGRRITILIQGQEGTTSPDEFGRFSLNVNAKPGDRVRLEVYADGKLVYDDFQVLPGPVILKMHEPR